MKKKKKSFWLVFIAVTLLFAGTMVVFTVQNNKRVVNYNLSYLNDSTVKAAETIDENILAGYANIKILSELVSNSLKKPEFDISNIQHLINNSVFDFMEFADKDGYDHNITGGVSDARDRKYYLDAKAGNSGMELIYNSRATHETLLMFYSPVYFENEFVGSLVGVYQASNRITSLLNDNFFGVSSLSYLASEDGRIIACSEGFDPQKEMYLGEIVSDDDAFDASVKEAMASEGISNISIPGNDVGASLVKLNHGGYLLMRIFPEKAHRSIVGHSNALVYWVAALLVFMFVGLMVYWIRFLRSEQIEIEQARDYAEEAMKAAESANAAKTNFLFNMSHDIRTPMNAILGYSQLVKKELTKPKLIDYHEKIEHSGNLLLSIINNVLDMARIESGKMELNEDFVDTNIAFTEVLCVYEDSTKQKGLKFKSEWNVSCRYLYCDQTKIKELFLNLISNSVKYTQPGGSITVCAEELPCEKEGYVRIKSVVEDTGIGMSPDFLPHVFESFARERNTTTCNVIGTGLGMPIVKKIVDLMGGSIEVESELGKGTKITVILDHRIAQKSDYEAKETVIDESQKDLMRGKHILLAEDNELNAEIAIEILSDRGLVVERVCDGIQCVAAMEREPAGTYDVILMDVQMPNMDGYKATQTIRKLEDKAKAGIPIIAMTANAFEEDRRNAFAAGMNDHITKPIKVEKVEETLLKFLEVQA